MIKLNAVCEKPEDAIREAGNLLLQNGLCTQNYIDKMVDSYNTFGDYIVVDEKIAMPHARPEDGAINSGFSIVTLKTPIEFGHDENDPVSVVFGLVGKTSDDHINTITKIASLCESKNFITSLLNCTSIEEVVELLK